MASDAPIFGFNDARADIVRTVIDRVMIGTRDPLLALNDAAYHETKRLEGSRRAADQRELAEWQKLARGLARMSDAERRTRLRELCERYGWDVAGNFNPRVFRGRDPPHAPAGHRAPRAQHLRQPGAHAREDHQPRRARRQGPRRGAHREAPAPGAARHRGLRADAPLEHGLDRLRLRARARGAAAGHLRRGQEPVHQPAPLLLHAQPRRVPRRPAHQARPLQGRAQDLLVRPPRARLPLALLPRAARGRAPAASSGGSSSGSSAARWRPTRAR